MIRSTMTEIPSGSYERIFGHSGRKIDYSENSDGPQPEKKDTTITLVDDDGKKVDRVTVFHKNKIYKQAKEMKENLKHALCTKDECWNPNDKNVEKMIKNEFKNPHTRAYKMAMQAIGADPRDCDVEKLRR